MKSSCDLFIMAAEPSADLHGAELIQEIQKLNPSLKIHAVAGPRMRNMNIKTIGAMEDLQVMGFIDVLIALPRILRHFFHLRKKILKLNPKIALFIDYPGFNLRLERSLRKKNFKGKIIHYICPTVWAWGKKRIPLMAENLDLLLTLLPFESKCFSHTSLPVCYVGNPVSHLVLKHGYNASWRDEKKIHQERKVIGIFPGSRQKEIIRNLPLQLEAVKKLCAVQQDLFVAVSIAQKKDEILIAKIVKESGLENILLTQPQENYDLMKHCDLAIATSGTVTLELALHAVPTVVTYAIKRWDQFLAQKLFKINLPHYCLVNIIAGKEVFPEYFGTNLTLPAVLLSLENFLHNPKNIEKCLKSCQEIKNILASSNPSKAAAVEVLKCLPQRTEEKESAQR